MLNEISEKDIKTFRNIAKKLAAFSRDISDRYPGAQLYLEEDTLHLLSGDSHDDNGRARQDRIIESVWIPKAGGGAW